MLDKNRLESLSCPQVLVNKKNIRRVFVDFEWNQDISILCLWNQIPTFRFVPNELFFKMTKELQKTGYDKTKHVQSCYVLHVKQKASCSTLPLRDHNVIDDDSAFLYDVLKACRLEKKVYSKGILTTYCNYLMLFLKVKVYNLLCGLSFSYCYGAII